MDKTDRDVRGLILGGVLRAYAPQRYYAALAHAVGGDLDCPDCGETWPDNASACPECGLSVEQVAQRLADRAGADPVNLRVEETSS